MKKLLIILSIVVIASVLSGCKHLMPAGFPEVPEYRECLYTQDKGLTFIRCEYMVGNKPPENMSADPKYLNRFLMIPLTDVQKLEKQEAEAASWIKNNCAK